MKSKRLFQITSVIFFILSLAGVCLFFAAEKSGVSAFKGDGFVIEAKNPGSEINFILIEKNRYKNNEINSIKSLLRQNNMGYYQLSFDGKNEEKAFEEFNSYLEREKLSQDTIVISHLRDYNDKLNINQIKGTVICSPVKVGEMSEPLLLISTTVDRVSTPEVITEIFNEKTGSQINATGFGVNAEKDNVTLSIVPKNFENSASLPKDYVVNISDWVYNNYHVKFRYRDYGFIKILIVLAMMLSLIVFYGITDLNGHKKGSETVYRLVNVKVESQVKYLLARLVIWLFTLPLCLASVFIIWIVPQTDITSANVLSLYLFSSGIVTMILYKLGKMPGVEGKVNYRDTISSSLFQMMKSCLLFMPLILIGIALVLLGLAEAEFRYKYLPEFIIDAVGIFAGYYVYNYEKYILSQMEIGRTTKLIYSASIFIPMLFIAVLCIPLGYTTWLYTSLMQIISIVTITVVGDEIGKINNDIAFSSLLQALICSGFFNYIRLI